MYLNNYSRTSIFCNLLLQFYARNKLIIILKTTNNMINSKYLIWLNCSASNQFLIKNLLFLEYYHHELHLQVTYYLRSLLHLFDLEHYY